MLLVSRLVVLVLVWVIRMVGMLFMLVVRWVVFRVWMNWLVGMSILLLR